MSKSQGQSEVEYLRGLVKQQRSELKHLRRELKKVSRDSRRYKELQSDLEDEAMEEGMPQTHIGETCPDCKNGALIRETLGVRILVKCGSCKYSRWEKSGK